MNGREDELGRRLGIVLREETQAMRIDTATASRRLDGELRHASRRRRVGVAAGIASAAALGILVWNFQTDGRQVPSPAEPPNNTGTPQAPYLFDLATREQTPLPDTLLVEPELDATYSRDATMVAINCPAMSCPGHGKLEIADADGGTVTDIPVPEESRAITHAWSLDGTMLLYSLVEGDRDLGDLFVYDLDRGVSTQLTDLGLESVYWVDLRADFTADGESVLFHRPRDATQDTRLDVWTVPVTGGEPQRVLRDAAQPEALNPPGRIAFVQPEEGSPLTGQLVAWAQSGGPPPQTLFEVPFKVLDFQLSPDGTRALVTDGDSRIMVEVTTGDVIPVPAPGFADGAQWVGNDSLLVTPQV